MSPDPTLPVAVEGQCARPELCPLNRVLAGTSVRIKQLSSTPEVNHRLRELGFCEEQRIKLLLKHTSVICQVCNARLGLSSKLAESILVEPVAGPSRPNPKPAS